MRLFICALAVSAAAFAGVIGGSTEFNPVRTHPRSQAQGPVHRVIVKLRAASPAPSGAGQSLSAHERITNLVGRIGLNVREAHAITDRLHAMQLVPVNAGDSIETTLARLRADSDVEYAEADQRRFVHMVPNDPLYPATGPMAPGQWYMQPSSSATPSAVDAQTAWTTTTGSASLVIADIDTGVLFSHPDLLAATSGGRLLPGYCFITDPFIANGNSCPGPDASDPGDWVTQQDLSKEECTAAMITAPSPSSWHGTRTAGILGALTNNSLGMAGMTWQGQIQPLRALGKCGGNDSDIVTAMLWAAGIAVTGFPANPNPAKIINMSLGGQGACPQTYIDVINQVTAKGVLVVASAGNEGGPVDTPANCPGVAGIAGLRQAGTKVGFSSLGREVALAAPAGNCVNSTITQATPCVYSIQTTTNNGTTTPNMNTYTDQVNDPNLGTSFSAPIVSGIAALMSTANGHLNSCQLIARLQESSLPFPQTSVGESPQPPACHVPSGSKDVQNSECLCTLDGQTCGAGMANAAAAVTAALRPIAVVKLPATVTAGQPVALDATGSVAANGHTINTFQWMSTGAQVASIQNGSTAKPTVTAPSCGLETVQLTVTDDAGRTDIADVVLSPASATSAAPNSASATTCAPKPAVMVAVCPASSSVQAGSGTQTFSASVANTTNTGVIWAVNGITGGNMTVGTISSTGVYTAPASVPSPSTVTVEAISDANSSAASTTQVTVTAPPSSGGGGALDPLTLLAEALVLGATLLSRRYPDRQTSRCAASSQERCARR